MTDQNTNVQAAYVVDGLLREVSNLMRRAVIAEAMYAQAVAAQQTGEETSDGEA